MKYVLDILFPHTCPVCHRPLKEERCLCEACVQQMSRTEQALIRDNETEKLFASTRHFAYGGCWLLYKKGTWLQHLIHQVKFANGDPKLLEQLGRECAMEWEESGFFDAVDLLVPIPLHKRRLKTRGFNQSEIIAKGMSQVLKIPMDTNHLVRYKATKQQSLSTLEERLNGIKDAFRVEHPEEWYGKTIVLVDDIITTGATMRAAMDAMKEVYRCRIIAFGLAKTQ